MRTTLVQFGAEWCGPCKMQRPICERAAKTAGSEFIYIDVDEVMTKEEVAALEIEVVPTIVVYSGEKEVARFVGRASETALVDALQLVYDDDGESPPL